MHVQAMVLDLGFVETAVDKIVDYTKGIEEDEGVEKPNSEQLATSAFAQGSRLWGPEAYHVVWWTVPINVLIMCPLWLGELIHIRQSIKSKLLLLRLLRMRFLLAYFTEVGSCHTSALQMHDLNRDTQFTFPCLRLTFQASILYVIF
jgi:hypothetical protein